MHWAAAVAAMQQVRAAVPMTPFPYAGLSGNGPRMHKVLT